MTTKLHSGERPRSRAAATITILGLLLAAATPASATTSTGHGPSTTTDPYVLPVADGVSITSLLTVGDAGSASNGYEMVGIPDGLGAFQQGANLVLYMNQELRDNQGIARRHGQTGAYDTRWVIDPVSLEIKEGSDLINPGVSFWDYPSGSYVTAGARFSDNSIQDTRFARFCSGTLSDPGLFYNEAAKTGFKGQLDFANEEDGDFGRSFAITKEGDAFALPRLGLFSWENTKPAANASNTTLVIGDEDGPGTASQLWVYVGTKQNSGAAIDKAGLTNGTDHVIDAVNDAVTNDALWRTTYGKGTPAPVTLLEIPWNQTGTAQNTQALGGLNLNRIEDGHWDPQQPNDFYFLTTEGGSPTEGVLNTPTYRDPGGLWKLHFNNIENPSAGASLTLLLDGSEWIQFNKPDNMAIDGSGHILIQEDPGNANSVARIVAYRISDGKMAVIAQFDASLFAPGAANLLTIDEESSGIIDTEDLLGAGTFLFDAQVHTPAGLPAGTGPGTVQEYVERGQLLKLKVNWADVEFTADD